MAGRPTKYSTETADKILQALRAGNTLRASARYVGVTEDTLINWRKRYSDFSAQVDQAEAEVEVRCVAQIAKSINEGNTADAWKWLERRRHDDWRERKTVDAAVTGPGGGPIVFSLSLGDAEPRDLDIPAT
jgi:transposase-like protein